MRRVTVGNFVGAKKCWFEGPVELEKLVQYENNCIWNLEVEEPVQIKEVVSYLDEVLA